MGGMLQASCRVRNRTSKEGSSDAMDVVRRCMPPSRAIAWPWRRPEAEVRTKMPWHTRVALSFVLGAQVVATNTWASEAPRVGVCPDCIGVLNGYLNSCPEEVESCASTQNDDEAHFVPPWEYEGTKEDAKQQLVEVAVNGVRDQMYDQLPSSETRAKVASWIVKTTGSVMAGRAPPARPPMELGKRDTLLDDFVGEVAEDNGDYMRIVFTGKGKKQGLVYDAEFLFLKDDSIIDTRIALRNGMPEGKGQLQASLSRGLFVDRNGAKSLLDELRKSLHWQSAPVVTGFDPGFNDKKKLWFEDAFESAQDPRKLFQNDSINTQDELLSGDPYY